MRAVESSPGRMETPTQGISRMVSGKNRIVTLPQPDSGLLVEIIKHFKHNTPIRSYNDFRTKMIMIEDGDDDTVEAQGFIMI